MAAPPQNPVWLLLMTTVITIMMGSNILLGVEGAYWCVARSDASNQALQTALDYACASGADCTPLLSNGLCFLPNTIQAHASYAFNSFFQRKAMAPGSCDFSGTATIAQTDPSMSFPFSLLHLLFFKNKLNKVNMCVFFLFVFQFFVLLNVGFGSCVYPSSVRYVCF